MIINSLSELTNCPLCGRHCPIESPSCGRGKALVAQLSEGKPFDTDAAGHERSGNADEEAPSSHRHRHGHGGGHHHHGH